MDIRDYISDKKIHFLTIFSGALFFTALLWLFGLGAGELILLWICFICMVTGIVGFDYVRLRRRLADLQSVLDSLDQKYLLAEIADRPQSVIERFYFRFMRTALKAMTDEVSASRRLNDEYRDFVEQWIHEMKAPITGIALLCENNRSDVMRKVMTEAVTHSVYSDRKWLQFMLNQILLNSVKYQGCRPLVIEIASRKQGNDVILSVTDNGMGIRESELCRVFDKGFVGSNGRAGKHATGIGLYLCDQLSRKLGIELEIESEPGEYTTVQLRFP